MVDDLLHHHPLLSCTICFNNYASSISKYQAKLKESMFIKWEKPDQYPFEEFLVRAICCCSSRRAMSPFILEVSTELRMDLKSRWSSSVTHKHSDSNFVRQYFSCHWAFLFSFKIKFTFTSFPSSPIREFLVFMILEYVSFLLDKSLFRYPYSTQVSPRDGTTWWHLHDK